jgi:hypothetical protein
VTEPTPEQVIDAAGEELRRQLVAAALDAGANPRPEDFAAVVIDATAGAAFEANGGRRALVSIVLPRLEAATRFADAPDRGEGFARAPAPGTLVVGVVRMRPGPAPGTVLQRLCYRALPVSMSVTDVPGAVTAGGWGDA